MTHYATYEDAAAANPHSPLVHLDGYDEDEILALYDGMTDIEQIEFDLLLKTGKPALMPHQIVPWDIGWWEIFFLIGGRGTGKTVTGSSAVVERLEIDKRTARIGVGAPTNADVRDTCFEGETGLMTLFPDQFTYYNRSTLEARHISGGFVKGIGMEKPARWNGPQWSLIWIDEISLCNQDSIDQANMGLRKGGRPRAIYTGTPKNKKFVKKIAMESTTYVPQYMTAEGKRRLPTTFDNLHLPKARVDWLDRKYGGSRIGRQELLGEFIDDVEGAMWDRKWFIHETDPDQWPRFIKIVVAIDPAGSTSRRIADKNSLTEDDRQNQRKNADTAISVIGLGVDGRLYVLQVKSGQWHPNEWAKEAIRLYHIFRADRIIAEKNFGGDMVESNLRNVDFIDKKLKRRLIGRNLPIRLITASRGKDVRAEPVATLYEQQRVVHCAHFSACEDQMCAFIDAERNEGADMVDSTVWGITDLAGLGTDEGGIIIVPGDARISAYASVISSVNGGVYERQIR